LFFRSHAGLNGRSGGFLDGGGKELVMNRTASTVVFSHGKESGPWGAKITALAEVVRDLEMSVESVDYQGLDDPGARVAKLLGSSATRNGPLVLVGSSMGGHVSAAAAATLKPRGLFLLAPAFYMPGFEAHTPQQVDCPVAIVHGWRDEVVPVENSIRWARERGAALHLLDSDHRLTDQIDRIGRLLRDFLTSV
jgi:alpha-beta hydrolase superfamily lysophospholipase